MILSIDDVGQFVDVEDFKKELTSLKTYIKMRDVNVAEDYLMYLWALTDENSFIMTDEVEEQLVDCGLDEKDIEVIYVAFKKMSDVFYTIDEEFHQKTGIALCVEYDNEDEIASFVLSHYDIYEMLVKQFGKGVQVG
jgi:hypothetical protein